MQSLIVFFFCQMHLIWFWRERNPFNSQSVDVQKSIRGQQHRQDICHVFPWGFKYLNPSHTIAVLSGLSVCPMEIKEWPRQQSLCVVPILFGSSISNRKRNEWLRWHTCVHTLTHTVCAHNHVRGVKPPSFFWFSSKSNIKKDQYIQTWV